MRRAGHKRPVSARAIPATPAATAVNGLALADTPPTDELTPTSDGASQTASDALDDCDIRRRTLEIAIYQRIESRLTGRVRNLHVRVRDGVVVLDGECATFYTKQLAQHTAMAILEDEHLENAIVVRIH